MSEGPSQYRRERADLERWERAWDAAYAPAPFAAPPVRAAVNGSPAIPGPLLAGILAVYTGVLPATEAR